VTQFLEHLPEHLTEEYVERSNLSTASQLAWWECRYRYVMIAETDHLLLRSIPNRATPTTPVCYPFACGT
jgi:hypothetical protein